MRRIFLARGPVDMRRGIDTLSAMVAGDLGEDPFTGDCFVFVGRDRRRLKVLVWETGGFWLCQKRLEAGTLPMPAGWRDPSLRSVSLTPAQMLAMLEGIDVRSAIYRKRYRRSSHTGFTVGDSLRAAEKG